MPTVNLLPWRQRRRQREQRVFAAQLIASFAAAALLATAFGVHLDALLDRQQGRNRLLQDQIADLDGRTAEVDAVRRRQQETDQRAGLLARLWRDNAITVDIFNELAQTTVVGTHYIGLRRRGDTVAVRGVAASNDHVSRLMHNLQGSDRFAAPTLKAIDAGASEAYGDEATTFALTFEVRVADAADGGIRR